MRLKSLITRGRAIGSPSGRVPMEVGGGGHCIRRYVLRSMYYCTDYSTYSTYGTPMRRSHSSGPQL